MIDATETALHRALGGDGRSRILAELESLADPLDAAEIGRRVGLHANTVRWHLGILAEAGLVRSRSAPRQTPGRPKIVYEVKRGSAAKPRENYRLLATMLSGVVADRVGGAGACEEAGRVCGRELVRQREPGHSAPAEEAIGEVVDLLAEQGFRPKADGFAIELHRCPFHDLAENHPKVVCALHRGLINGALGELGSHLAVRELEIFPRPDICVAWLAPSRHH